MKKLLQVDPKKRPSLEDLLKDEFFDDVQKLFIDEKDSHEYGLRMKFLRKKKIQKQKESCIKHGTLNSQDT